MMTRQEYAATGDVLYSGTAKNGLRIRVLPKTGFSGFFGSQPKGLPIPYGFTYNAGIIGTENGICDRPPVEKYARRYIEGCSELLGTISCERSGVGKLLSPFPVADSEMFEVQGNIHPVAYIFFNIHLINHKEVDPVVF